MDLLIRVLFFRGHKGWRIKGPADCAGRSRDIGRTGNPSAHNYDIRALLPSFSCSSSIKTSRNCNRDVDLAMESLEKVQEVLPHYLLIDSDLGGNDIYPKRFELPGTYHRIPGIDKICHQPGPV